MPSLWRSFSFHLTFVWRVTKDDTALWDQILPWAPWLQRAVDLHCICIPKFSGQNCDLHQLVKTLTCVSLYVVRFRFATVKCNAAKSSAVMIMVYLLSLKSNLCCILIWYPCHALSLCRNMRSCTHSLWPQVWRSSKEGASLIRQSRAIPKYEFWCLLAQGFVFYKYFVFLSFLSLSHTSDLC